MMKRLTVWRNQQDGQILITLVIVIPALVLIAASYLTLTTSGYRLERQDQFRTQAQLAADAGIDYSVEQINQSSTWTGASETTLLSSGNIRTTYSESVADNGSGGKELTSIGRSYFPASATTASATTTIIVDLRPVTSGDFSVVSGEGGLNMSNNSKIIGGDVLINGQINLSNSAQIGLSTNPVNVDVADEVCPSPPDSTYPRICNSGEGIQPISINNSAHIYGTVKANNQTSSNGMSSPGLTASSGVATQSLPAYDRDSQKAAVTTTVTGTSASCSSGTKTWAANTEITGDVSVSNSCKVTVQGNIWITGNLTVSNSSKLIVADALGSTRPVIMVDGSNGGNFSNGSTLASNASSTGFEIITYWSKASCSPDCSSVTGTDLFNSRNHTTINLSNSSQGPDTIFYSRWTEVQISNSGQIGALIGETIQMSNTAAVTFNSSAGVGNTYWVVNGYRRSF